MKYIKPETTYTTVGLLNIILTSNKEHGIGEPSTGKGEGDRDGNIFMSKHESFGFGDSDDSFNDTWDQ